MKETFFDVRFLATYVMAPVAHVLVYYVRDDGELVADSLDVELEGTLQNFVSNNFLVSLTLMLQITSENYETILRLNLGGHQNSSSWRSWSWW